MKHYVLGFIFGYDGSCVLLLKKKRPAWMKGRWNGIGGKIEDKETPEQAMDRECKEETAWNYCFDHKITFTCPGGTIYVFAAKISEALSFDQVEDEKLDVFPTNSIPPDAMSNLKWIIPLCLADIRTPIMIEEIGKGI